MCGLSCMTQSDREAAQVARAERTHRAVMEAMARAKPGSDTYTWRDRYLDLFHALWDRQNRAPQQVDVSADSAELESAATLPP
jgi:hypothetical protein